VIYKVSGEIVFRDKTFDVRGQASVPRSADSLEGATLDICQSTWVRNYCGSQNRTGPEI
jgi:hypothetical protein